MTCITNLSAKLNYCDDGRRIQIDGREIRELCELWLTVQSLGKQGRLFVVKTGQGIEESYREILF